MTFNPNIPLNSDSPSLFPEQNQTNNNRLKTIIESDHKFNLSAADDDGYHNVIHLTQEAPTGSLAATGRLYAKTDGGFVNLFYIDDAGKNYQITPVTAAPTKVSGSVILPGNQTSVPIYTMLDNSQGTIFVNYINPPLSSYSYYIIYKSGSVMQGKQVIKKSLTVAPDIVITGSNISIKNNTPDNKTIGYYINLVSI